MQEGGLRMSEQMEHSPAVVSERTKQAGEIRGRWSWTEPCVWTEAMLAALESGVKGGKWFSLIDKVYSPANLRAAFERVRRNKGSAGVDHVTLAHYECTVAENLTRVSEALREGQYHPQAIRRTWIPKPGSTEKRPLGIPTVQDRIVQTALRNVVEPIFEREFAEHSYGFRPGRGCKDALRRVDALLRQGHTWVVDADIKGYFDSIPHEPLLALVGERVSDGQVLDLIQAYLKQDILETMRSWTPEQGSPQGAVISPLLSNIYLNPLDHLMAAAGFEMVRYADDFVVLCRSEREAREALTLIQQWMAQAQLTLHPVKTRIVDAMEKGVGFDFLGYHFQKYSRWARTKSVDKLKATLRAKTKRTNGHSLQDIIDDVNRTLRGWFEYFKESNKPTFPSIDIWIRVRLRSILRKRSKRKGRGRGYDHLRWPNAYFAERGLFNLTTARQEAGQSP